MMKNGLLHGLQTLPVTSWMNTASHMLRRNLQLPLYHQLNLQVLLPLLNPHPKHRLPQAHLGMEEKFPLFQLWDNLPPSLLPRQPPRHRLA
jgi:hypothetical protein